MNILLDEKIANVIINKINSEYVDYNFNTERTIITKQELSFYPNHDLINITDYSCVPYNRKLAFYNSEEICFFNLSAREVYSLNNNFNLKVTRENGAEYIKFVLNNNNVAYNDGGRIFVVENINELNFFEDESCVLDSLKSNSDTPMYLFWEKGGSYFYRGVVCNNKNLIFIEIMIKENGELEIRNSCFLFENMKVPSDYLYVIDNSFPHLSQANHVLEISNRWLDEIGHYHTMQAYFELGKFVMAIFFIESIYSIYYEKINSSLSPHFEILVAYIFKLQGNNLNATDFIANAIKKNEESSLIDSSILNVLLENIKGELPSAHEYFLKQHYGGNRDLHDLTVKKLMDEFPTKSDIFTNGMVAPCHDQLFQGLLHRNKKQVYSNSINLDIVWINILERNKQSLANKFELSNLFIGCTLDISEEPAISFFHTGEFLGHLIEIEIRLMQVVRDVSVLYLCFATEDIYQNYRENDLDNEKVIKFTNHIRSLILGLFVHNDRKSTYVSPIVDLGQLEDEYVLLGERLVTRAFEFIICHEVGHHLFGHTEALAHKIPHNDFIDEIKDKYSKFDAEEVEADLIAMDLFLLDLNEDEDLETVEATFLFDLLPIYIAFFSFNFLYLKKFDINQISYVDELKRIATVKKVIIKRYEEKYNLDTSTMNDVIIDCELLGQIFFELLEKDPYLQTFFKNYNTPQR